MRLLDRHADDVGNAVEQTHRVVRGRARRVVVDAHRADHLRVVAADGGGPAGAQSERLDDVAVLIPQRVGVDVFHHHALVEEHGRAARTVRGPDRQPDQHLREHERQRRRHGLRDMFAVATQQDRTHRTVVEQRLHQPTYLGQQVRQRHVARTQFEHGLFAAQQFLGTRRLCGQGAVVGFGVTQSLFGLLALGDVSRDHLDGGAPAKLHGCGQHLHVNGRAIAAQQSLLHRRQARAVHHHPLAALAGKVHRVPMHELVQLPADDVAGMLRAKQPNPRLVDENDDVVRHDVQRIRHLPDERLVTVVSKR